MSTQTGVLVPVKSFRDAKVRLASALDAEGRSALAREMAEVVVAAAAPLTVAVVCDDPEVAAWAEQVGAEVFWYPRHGLNGAVTEGVERFARLGFERVIVAHADLPLASVLAHIGDFPGITLVPDRRGDGTNVIGVPARSGFCFQYGARSFERHLLEAVRLGLATRVLRERNLAWDVDVPDDLAYPAPLETGVQ